MAKSKVVLTGAAGKIAGQLRPFLAERYDLTLLDVRTTGRDGQEIPGIQIADLTERNRDAYREHFRGADAVVHLGFVGAENPSDPEQRFQAEYANVGMAYNVYKDVAGGGRAPRGGRQLQPRGGLLRRSDFAGQDGLCRPQRARAFGQLLRLGPKKFTSTSALSLPWARRNRPAPQS